MRAAGQKSRWIRHGASRGCDVSLCGSHLSGQAFPGHGLGILEDLARDLFDALILHKKRRERAVAEGNRLAVYFVLTLQNEKRGGEAFEQEEFDLWTFDDEGRITSGLQFQDTAKIIAELK